MQEIDPGSAKILQKPAKDDIYKMLWPYQHSTAARHRKIREEHQHYPPANSHPEGKPSSKHHPRPAG